MSGSKLRWGFVLGTVFLFWFLYSTVHGIKAEQLLLDYQISRIQETLVIHTEKLEILVGSHYELHNKIDQIMKGTE